MDSTIPEILPIWNRCYVIYTQSKNKINKNGYKNNIALLLDCSHSCVEHVCGKSIMIILAKRH